MYMMTKLICITQTYEWIQMKLIINWQETKDLTQMLIFMDDLADKRKFLKTENIRKYTFYVISAVVVAIYIAILWGLIRSYNIFYYIQAVLSDLFIVVGLIYSYSTLNALISKYHPIRYAEIKVQMVFFFFVETIPLVISNIFNIFEIINNYDKKLVTDSLLHQMQIIIAFIWILYPLL